MLEWMNEWMNVIVDWAPGMQVQVVPLNNSSRGASKGNILPILATDSGFKVFSFDDEY